MPEIDGGVILDLVSGLLVPEPTAKAWDETEHPRDEAGRWTISGGPTGDARTLAMETGGLPGPAGTTIRHDVHGASDGQIDATLYAYDGDTKVARLDYSLWRDKPGIKMVEVEESHRRRGIAEALVRELGAMYPKKEIEWGMLTEGGAALREAMGPQPGKFETDWNNMSLTPYQRADAFPLAKETVDGRKVRGDLSTARGAEVDNYDSIAASLGNDWTEADDIREVPMAAFEDNGKPTFYSQTEKVRTQALAEEIKASGEIAPLIVVVDDKKSPYILEGGHRYDALRLLGAKSFPALVVADISSLDKS